MKSIQYTIEKDIHVKFSELAEINRSHEIRKLIIDFINSDISLLDILGDIVYHTRGVDRHKTCVHLSDDLFDRYVDKCDFVCYNKNSILRALIKFRVKNG